jgi:NitT/TauT family transport system permease protein
MVTSTANRITAAQVVSPESLLNHRYLHRTIFFTLLIGVWYLLTSIGIYPKYLLPSPADVFETLIWGFSQADYAIVILQSLRRVISGYFLAVFVGVFSGLAIARYKALDNTLGASLTALQSIPSVAWVPLALLWFGITESAALFIVVLEAFIPCALGVRTSVLLIPKEIIRAAQCLGSKSFDLYIRVIFPSIIPQLVSSLRLSWAFAWRALIAGELFITGLGIGQTLELGRSLADMSQVLAMILIVAVLGFITDNVFFRAVEKKVNAIWGL